MSNPEIIEPNGPFPVKTRWGWVLAYGVLVAIIGFVALVNPLATGLATGVLLSVILLFYGVAALLSGISSFSVRGRWIEIALGVLALIASLVVFFSPLAGALSLVWAIGFWLLLSGAFQVAGAIRIAFDRWWRLFLGVVDLLLGAILMFGGALPGLTFLALIVGISFLFKGVFLVMLALGLRGLSRRVNG